MKEKYIIVRAKREALEGLNLPMAGPAGNVGAMNPRDLRIEMDELSPREAGRLSTSGEIVSAAPNMPLQLIAPTPDAAAPLAGVSTWGVVSIGAQTSPFTGSGIKVAVLDTGIARNHDAFQGGVAIVEKDFTGEGNGDTNGHGTHCAGTIFGSDVGGQRIGVARGVQQALIGKVLGNLGGGTNELVQAILWAQSMGAHVVSMSLGIDFPGYVEKLTNAGFPVALATSRGLHAYRLNVLLFQSIATSLAAMAAFSQPCLIVAAAGNESKRDTSLDFEIHVSPPAVSDGVISVAALGEGSLGLKPAPFSNTGALISGPGVKVFSARHDQTNGLISLSGTSMAAPHVAGAAALWADKLRQANALTQTNLMARLLGNATMTGLAQPVDPADVGAGNVQAPQN